MIRPPLTTRAREVLGLIWDGLVSREIADRYDGDDVNEQESRLITILRNHEGLARAISMADVVVVR